MELQRIFLYPRCQAPEHLVQYHIHIGARSHPHRRKIGDLMSAEHLAHGIDGVMEQKHRAEGGEVSGHKRMSMGIPDEHTQGRRVFHLCVCVCVCVGGGVCLCVSARARACMFAFAFAFAVAFAFVFALAFAFVCVCVCVCVRAS